jgi:nucleotide-binding universal stress UspA family protein
MSDRAAGSPCIVVGFDGSPASRAALSLAVRRARPDGRIVVVHSFTTPADRYGRPNTQRLLDAELSRARAIVAHLAEEVPGLNDVEWASDIVGEHPAEALRGVAEVERATEIIIGTRGFGRARALLGSVAHELIHLARCPVTVIPERAIAAAEEARERQAAAQG